MMVNINPQQILKKTVIDNHSLREDVLKELLDEQKIKGYAGTDGLALFDLVLKAMTMTNDADNLSDCLRALDDILGYHPSKSADIPSKTVIWLTSFGFTKEFANRYLKLDVCTLLVSIYCLNKSLQPRIEKWFERVFTGKDAELQDYLAFAMGQNEDYHPSTQIQKIFHLEIQNNPDTERTAEMAVPLARIHDEFVYPFIIRALRSGMPDTQYYEAALIWGGEEIKALLTKLLADKDEYALDFKESIEDL